MKNGLENGFYHEITPSGFGIAIKAGKLLYSKQSEFQKVEVFETESSLGRVLTLDDLMMTTEGDEFHYHEMIAHVPMMHHPNPKTVLVIGGGDGGTVREVLKHDTVEKVVLCEIDGLVIEACKEYLPTISCELDNPKCEILVEDAIEYIKNKENMFDIVLIDSTDPMGPGEGLFTEEFYTNVKNSLKEGGIIAAQSESPFVNKEEIKTQVKEAAKKQIETSINNAMTEETKQQIQQTQEAATKIKNILSNKESIKSSLKERAQQAKQNAINQLKQDLQSTIETNTQNTNSTQTE